MNNAQIEQLVKVYNTLLLVTTKGEDTIIMGQCLHALYQLLTELQNNVSSTDIASDQSN